MTKTKSITVQGGEIQLATINDQDYISLTDMVAQFEGGTALIDNWLRNKNTIEFLGVWEMLNNSHFNSLEFEGIRSNAGLNRFTMSAKKWADTLHGIGGVARAGRYGGTYAHRDIAFEFGSWLSPEFKLYLIKEFQRLKENEANSGQLEWNIRRSLTKTQYRIHTDAVKEHLIPPKLSAAQAGFIYASEADVLNVALFGQTARQWKEQNPEKNGNVRDYATVEQLVVLASLESQNALLIEQKVDQDTRLQVLNDQARKQIKSLMKNSSMRQLQDRPLLDN